MSSSSNAGLPDSKNVIGDLNEYKVLECSCCKLMLGFQHKATGLVRCTWECHQLLPTNPISILSTTPQNIIPFENPLVNPVKARVVSASPPTTEKMEGVTVMAVEASAPAVITIKEEENHVPEQTTNLYTQLQYSENLVCPSAQVEVHHIYNPQTLHVVADADKTHLANLQVELATYALKGEKIKTPPAKDQVVIGEYRGQPYRARVLEVNGDNCKIEWIDYGDTALCKFTDLIPPNDAVMKHPLYGMTVKLAKIPDTPAWFEMKPAFQYEIYRQSYVVDPVQRNVKPVPGQAAPYPVRLWDMQQGTLNEKLALIIFCALRKCKNTPPKV